VRFVDFRRQVIPLQPPCHNHLYVPACDSCDGEPLESCSIGSQILDLSRVPRVLEFGTVGPSAVACGLQLLVTAYDSTSAAGPDR
jgi:hypothetical protein